MNDLKILVTSAGYDNIATVLDSLKLAYKKYSNNFDCNILFLNCGTKDSINTNELNNFVENGGVLYASDLTSSIVTSAFPNIFNFAGNSGTTGTLKASVVDEELKSIIGDETDIYFDMSSWSILNSINKGNVILKSKSDGKPLMVMVPFGEGKIYYTCFHNHKQTSEKESIILRLFVIKQISDLKNISIQQVTEDLKINLSEYKKLFNTQGTVAPTKQPVKKDSVNNILDKLGDNKTPTNKTDKKPILPPTDDITSKF
jgi:hypothetical protein